MNKHSRKKCGKIQYNSPAKARKALKALRAVGCKRFYLCPYCPGQYHLTSEDRG